MEQLDDSWYSTMVLPDAESDGYSKEMWWIIGRYLADGWRVERKDRPRGNMDLEQKAIQRLQAASEMSLHHYGKPLVCTYSGGKDSDVILELFKRADIPFEVHNSHTTADAPQTVRHIRETFRELEMDGIKCEIEMPTYKGERTSIIPKGDTLVDMEIAKELLTSGFIFQFPAEEEV